jgi:hypothetical protein
MGQVVQRLRPYLLGWKVADDNHLDRSTTTILSG